MKKLFALILTIAMLATMTVNTFATEIDQGTANKTGETTVSFEVAPTYIVTIPSEVTLNKQTAQDDTVTYESDYTITADAGVRLHKGDTIVVTVDSDYEMTAQQGATLTYTITKEDAPLTDGIVATFTTSTTEQSSTIRITANDPDYAGDYSDTVTFTISVQQAAPAIINFTIGGDSYQAEEGMTWAQWVESAYNNSGFYSAYESVYWGEDFWFILCNSGKTPNDDDYYVNAADVIQANTDYVRVELSEG